jgi:RNA polymerase sigma-70 factor (ECF subfamily)
MPQTSSFSKDREPRFATTRWSLIVQARDKPSPDAHGALSELCQSYWYPLYCLIRRRSQNSHEAQDLTQEFFSRLLEKDFLGDVDQSRGRFRSFLSAAVKHFLSNENDKRKTAKRGGKQKILSLDMDWDSGESRFLVQPSHELTAENMFEREWALTLLNRVLSRLRDEQSEAGKSKQFETLQPFLTMDSETANYADVASQLGMEVTAARMAAHRLRQRYRSLLREEIAHTVANAEEIEDELRHLFTALSSH